MKTHPPIALTFIATFALIFAGGCPSQPATGPTTTPTNNVEITDDPPELPDEPAGPLDAAALVAKMQQVYAQASSYSDEGVLYWQYAEDGAWQPVTNDFATKFARPNKLALKVRGLNVVSDGQVLRAIIRDEATDDYDAQVLERRSPEALHLGDLYSDDEMANILGDAIIDGTPWPLRLLTGDAALDSFLSGKIGEMSNKPLAGRDCRRVRVRHEERSATLWIDPETYLLLRVELPPPAAKGLRGFIAEFHNARVNDNAQLQPSDWKLQRPAAAKVVSFFVPPPLAIDIPSPLFGETVGDFTLETLGGEPIKRDQLGERAVVLAWFLNDEASQQTMRQLQAIAEKFQGPEAVNFYAISPHPEAVTSDSIAKSLADIGVSLPILRDTAAVGRDTFDVPGAPTVVVLDGDFRVQGFKAGADPQMGEFLPMLLEQLLAGKNPAGDLRRAVAAEAAQYRRRLAEARSSSSTLLELAETPLAPQSAPAKLKLTPLWNSREAKQPGNILVVPGDAGPRIFVHDHQADWRTLVELNSAGETVARRQLPVGSGTAISSLRTIIDGKGRRWFAGGAPTAQQVFVLNEKLELAFAYPPKTSDEVRVGDFALVDFQNDGNVQLCVGFWGLLGIHGVDIDGELKWTNRTPAPVAAIATTPPNDIGWRQILVTTDRGELVPINGFGKHDPPSRVDNHAITQLYTSPFARENAANYLGVALQADGSPQAVAMSKDLKVLWDMPLPAGTHRNQIRPVTIGKLLPGDAAHWIFAGADGSVGIVADDVSFYDSFNTGVRLSGVATARFRSDYVLLLSTPQGVAAWKVQQVAGPAP
mgnify:CR=1 FL=1